MKNADELSKVQLINIPHIDKIAHFGMYFILMSLIIFETQRASIKNRSLLLLSLYPFSYGIILEILQSATTNSRYGSLYDVIFNTLGILISVLLWLLLKSACKERFR
jgi:VanZ family protein